LSYRFDLKGLFLILLTVFSSGAYAASLKDLSQQREWLLLGHYKANIFGHYRSMVVGEKFFLAVDGPTSPEAELKATVEKFFSGRIQDRTSFQCAYLARRDYIVRNLLIPKEDVVDCPSYNAWIAQLNPGKISLIYATGSFQESASSFGHVFLRLENPNRPKGEELLNYGVNYAARTDNVSGALYALYGLFGYFPGTYGMAPYHHLIKQYTNMEGRDLWEYELNLSPDEIERLVKHLLELERGYFNYFFLDDNCARLIAVALEVARPSLILTGSYVPWSLPLDTVKAVVQSGLVSKKEFRPSLRTEFEESYSSLSSEEKQSLKFLKSSEINGAKNSSTLMAEMTSSALEAAQNFYALKGASDFQKYKNINHELAVARSKRNESVSRSSAIVNGPDSPDNGPGSSSISLGYVLGSEQISSARVGFRAVGHDLLDSQFGSAPFSELALGQIEAASQKTNNFNLSSFVAIHALSTQAVTSLEQPLSWGFAIQWSQGWQVPLRAGYAFDTGRLRSMMFAGIRLQEAIDEKRNLVPGLELLESAFVSNRIRAVLNVIVEADRGSSRGFVVSRYAGVAADIRQNLEIRIEAGHDDSVFKSELRYSF
jgi:hypothetical protein